MTFEMLKQNIEREQKISQEMLELYSKFEYFKALPNPVKAEVENLKKSFDSLAFQLKIINAAIPELIEGISFYKKIDANVSEKKLSSDLLGVKFQEENNREVKLAIRKKDKNNFLEHLTLYQSLAKQFKKKPNEEEAETNLDNIAFYMNISNKLFRNIADKLVAKGVFDSLKVDLRKITSPIIVNTYVAMMLFSSLVGVGLGLLFGGFFWFMKLGVLSFILSLVLTPLVILGIFYLYPSSRKKTLEKEINQEIPFLTIYMGAIATSGIEPSKIFTIIVASRDYPFVRREIKKLNNYINFYGYDLVGALKAVARHNPSDRLAQLFEGFATTISSGGDLTEFLSKHSDTLLFDYRLEREKYTRLAETFMNIYISVVIAAPMIMMMLFILMSLVGVGGALTTPLNIGLLTILIISLLNLGFLVLLNMKQPKF